MALKIVTGGTTGAADGTLVSSGNPLVITALNTAIDAHIRCDDGYWSNDQSFDVPAELQVSFDGGSTWYGNADEPITAPEIYAVNVPIKIRQTTAAAWASGSFVTDGTYTAIAALSTPTLTATVISATQIDLSWTNVANEDASPGYTIERSPNGSSWSSLTTKAANVTTHSDTGLTAGTRYYYRVKAEGSGRYSDSGWGTDDDTTSLPLSDTFTAGSATELSAHTPDIGSAPTRLTAFDSGTTPRIYCGTGGKAYQNASNGDAAYYYPETLPNDQTVQADVYIASGSASFAAIAARVATSGVQGLFAVVDNGGFIGAGVLRLYRYGGSGTASLGTFSQSWTTSSTYSIKITCVGTTIKVYVDGVERISVTESSLTGGKAAVRCGPGSSSTGVQLDNLIAY